MFEAGPPMFRQAEISLRELLRGNLDSDGAIEPRIGYLVHLAHTVGADGHRDFVGAEEVLWFQAHLSKACPFVTSTNGASTPGSRMTRTRKRLPSGATSYDRKMGAGLPSQRSSSESRVSNSASDAPMSKPVFVSLFLTGTANNRPPGSR